MARLSPSKPVDHSPMPPDAPPDPDVNRRLVKSRDSAWAKAIAARLAKAGVSPNVISFMGVAFALTGGAAFALSGLTFGPIHIGLLLLGVVGVQGRLLCNMFDGMVAVEHGKGGPTGPIWNELPDRIADVLLLAGAGYGAMASSLPFGPGLGWLCAVLAMMTAYVRELGRGLGFEADFSGPLAKPQRMGVLTAAALFTVFDDGTQWRGWGLMAGLCIIALLTSVTLIRRVNHLAQALDRRADAARRQSRLSAAPPRKPG